MTKATTPKRQGCAHQRTFPAIWPVCTVQWQHQVSEYESLRGSPALSKSSVGHRAKLSLPMHFVGIWRWHVRF